MRTLLALAPTALAALLSRSRARQVALQLHGLSDAQLKDIGISRCDIESVARGEMTTPFR